MMARESVSQFNANLTVSKHRLGSFVVVRLGPPEESAEECRAFNIVVQRDIYGRYSVYDAAPLEKEAGQMQE